MKPDLLLAVLIVLSPAWAAGQEAAPPAKPERPLNPTQEVTSEKPEGPALEAGPARFRLGGYLGVTGIYRSTNSGGGPGTNFASTPYPDHVEGNVSEARLSAQSSRLSLRVDADFRETEVSPTRLSGYFEMDFQGSTPGIVAVTSTSVGFRLRHAFGETEHRHKLLLAAGQAFSLMTPAKDQLSIWPADFDLSQAVDTSYLAGLVWVRSPQVRFTYRPSTSFNWAISVENPEQQLAKGAVTLPSCCVDDLEAQYNTGSNELKVPNLMPDIVSRVAFNRAGRLHLDFGGVLRVFRHTLAPYDRSYKQAGGGLSVDTRINPTALTKVVMEGAYGGGLGRYIGGLVPDVSIRADGTISPVRTLSWVAGIEQKLPPKISVAGYYSGVYAYDNFSLDTDGRYIGYGYPGSPDSNNRQIYELTGVVAYQAWQFKDRGSMQWNTQLSWLSRSSWSAGPGPRSAGAFLFFTQLRYNLP